MLEYGFCNAVNGSPSYNADHFNNFFAGILSDTGIYKRSGNAFLVTAGGGMTVNVATGRGRIDNHWVSLTASEVLAIEAAESNPRYDAIVLRYSTNSGIISLSVKKGTASSSPVKPIILNNGLSHEICLAYVYVSSGVTEITSSNIEDTRADVSVCGYVAMQIDTVNAKIQEYSNVTTTTNGVNEIEIGIPEYDSENDILFVSINGIMLVENIDYTKSGTGSSGVITTTNTIRKDNTIAFRVLKFVVQTL